MKKKISILLLALMAMAGNVMAGNLIITESNTEETAYNSNSLTTGEKVIINCTGSSDMNVYFDNFNWDAGKDITLAINCTGDGTPTIHLYFKGQNTFICQKTPAIYINENSSNKQCKVVFHTLGQSGLLVGSASESVMAIKDGGATQSEIQFQDDTKFDNIQLISWNDDEYGYDYEDYTGVLKNDFGALCKQTAKFVSIRMNAKSETRQTTSAWDTFSFPYSGTVTNGTMYTLEGTIKDSEDPTMVNYLVLKKVEGNEFEAGKAYIVKRNADGQNVEYTLTGTEHSDPIYCNGLVGYYTTQKMRKEGWFISGDHIYRVEEGNTNNIKYYRAYIEYLDEVMDNYPKGFYDASSIDGGMMLWDGSATTAIVSVKEFEGLTGSRVSNIQQGKFIQNGKVVILKDGARYNTAGQQVK